MAVRTTLPDTTTAAAAAVIFLFSLQFAASRTPSALHGNEVTTAATVAESDPAVAAEASKFKSNLRLPRDDIKDAPAPAPEPEHAPESVPENERENTATVRSVPLTRLRFNDLRPTDRRYFKERFGFPGSHCRHHHGGDRSFPTPVVTEIIRYVDDPAIPMEIIRYVEDTAAAAAQPKETEPVAKTSHHNLRQEGRDFKRPVEAQPVEAEFAKYVDEAEAEAAQPKEEAVEEKEMKPVRHSHHHLRHGGRAHPADVEIVKYADAMAATEATAEMVAAAQHKEEEKKEVKTERAATITGSPVYRSQYNLHRGSFRSIRRPVEAHSSGSSEVVRYRDAAAVTEVAQQPKETKTEVEAVSNNGDKDDGFSRYMMRYNSRNFQRFGNQKFVRHLPHKRGHGNGHGEEEKKGDFTRIVKRIRKFLDF